MATIVSNFFSALQDILQTLHVYDEPLPSDEDSIPDYWKETVPEIKDSLIPLFGDFYAVIHCASLDPEFGLIHDAVDWLFELVETISKGMPDTEVVFSHLSKSETRGMMDAVENGLARVPREMPRDPGVFSKAAPIAHRLILQKLSLKL